VCHQERRTQKATQGQDPPLPADRYDDVAQVDRDEIGEEESCGIIAVGVQQERRHQGPDQGERRHHDRVLGQRHPRSDQSHYQEKGIHQDRRHQPVKAVSGICGQKQKRNSAAQQTLTKESLGSSAQHAPADDEQRSHQQPGHDLTHSRQQMSPQVVGQEESGPEEDGQNAEPRQPLPPDQRFQIALGRAGCDGRRSGGDVSVLGLGGNWHRRS
jgi:hypothetical protein